MRYRPSSIVAAHKVPSRRTSRLTRLQKSGKPRIIVLGKADLADAAETEAWSEKLSGGKGVRRVMALNLQSGENIKKLLKALETEQQKRNEERSVKRPEKKACNKSFKGIKYLELKAPVTRLGPGTLTQKACKYDDE